MSPAESRIGSRIDLSGTGWPTGTGPNLVGIYYGGNQLSSATTDSSGEWSATIYRSWYRGCWEDQRSDGQGESGCGRQCDHAKRTMTLRAPVVNVSPAQAQRGDTVTVSGDNFHTFRPVTIDVGGSDVTPSATTTDGEWQLQRRGLGAGAERWATRTSRLQVNDVPVVEFLEIVATPVSTSMISEEAFADLVAANNLTVVWYFDNGTKAWSFYDPRPAVAAAVDLDHGLQRRQRLDPGRRRPDVPRRDADRRLELGNPQLEPGTATRQGGAARLTSGGPAPPFSKGTWRNE